MLDYRNFIEDYVQRNYTIGGTIIFPKHPGSVNQAKVIIIRKDFLEEDHESGFNWNVSKLVSHWLDNRRRFSFYYP